MTIEQQYARERNPLSRPFLVAPISGYITMAWLMDMPLWWMRRFIETRGAVL